MLVTFSCVSARSRCVPSAASSGSRPWRQDPTARSGLTSRSKAFRSTSWKSWSP